MGLYDKANKVIGIQSVEQQELNVFAIRHTAKGAYIGAKKFLKDTGRYRKGMLCRLQ